MRFLHALSLICGLVAPAAASQYFNTPVISTPTGTAWASQAGQFYVAASSANVSSITANVPVKSTWTITLNGASGTVTATQLVGGGVGITGVVAASVPQSGVNLSTVTTQFNLVAVATTAAQVQITTLFTNVNSTGAALTTEMARAIAAEGVLSASTVAVYSALNSTASYATAQFASVALATTTIEGQINSTASYATTQFTAVAAATTSIASGAILANSSITFSGTDKFLNPVTFSSTVVMTSTLTVQGSAFSVGGSTLVVASDGSITAPSQPGGRFYRSATQNIAASAETQTYFDTTDFSQGGITLVAASSGTITVPIAGKYIVICGWQSSASGAIRRYGYISHNGSSSQTASWQDDYAATDAIDRVTSDIFNAAASDTFRCMYASIAATSTLGGAGTSLSIQKLW